MFVYVRIQILYIKISMDMEFVMSEIHEFGTFHQLDLQMWNLPPTRFMEVALPNNLTWV